MKSIKRKSKSKKITDKNLPTPDKKGEDLQSLVISKTDMRKMKRLQRSKSIKKKPKLLNFTFGCHEVVMDESLLLRIDNLIKMLFIKDNAVKERIWTSGALLLHATRSFLNKDIEKRIEKLRTIKNSPTLKKHINNFFKWQKSVPKKDEQNVAQNGPDIPIRKEVVTSFQSLNFK